jgi:hypothetical protein
LFSWPRQGVHWKRHVHCCSTTCSPPENMPLQNRGVLSAAYCTTYHETCTHGVNFCCSSGEQSSNTSTSNWNFKFVTTSADNTYQLLIYMVYTVTSPDDGQPTCPKRVEVYWRNKVMINSASVGYIIWIDEISFRLLHYPSQGNKFQSVYFTTVNNISKTPPQFRIN